MKRGTAPLRRLAIKIDPAVGESFLGYLTRVAEMNVLRRPADILDGICAWPPAELTDRQLARAAGVLGIQPRVLDATYKRSFLRELPRPMLTYERRRFAPASLVLSPHHRASWLIKPIDFCAESWQILLQDCPSCLQPLSWGRPSVHRCDSCAGDLRIAESRLVPRMVRPFLNKAVQLATADPEDGRAIINLHPDLGALNSSQVFQLAVACGRALAVGPKRSREGWGYRDLAAGMKLVTRFPASIQELAGTNDNLPKPRFFARIRKAAEASDRDLRRTMLAISAMEPEAHGPVRLRKLRQANNLLTMTELARALRVENSRIRSMADAGVFGRRDARGNARKYDWFSDADYARGREFLDRRIFASAWAKQVDLSMMDVRQLVSAGRLDRCSGRAVDRVFAGGLQLTTESCRSFEGALLSRIRFSNDGSCWIPLERAFASIGGAYKPWAAVLSAALAGSLPYGLQYPGPYELRIGRLRIHETVAFDICRRALSRTLGDYYVPPDSLGPLRPQTISRDEAERLLNCLPADISRLCDGRFLRVVARDPVSFDARSVEFFAKRHVSVQELNALFGFPCAELARYLVGEGFQRTSSGFWRRKDLWGRDGMVARIRAGSARVISAWEIVGPPKPTTWWPEAVGPAAGRPLELFSRQQPDHP